MEPTGSSGLRTLVLLVFLLFVVPIGVVAFVVLRGDGPIDVTRPPPEDPALAAPPAYVGRAACVNCHREEHDAWVGSHHDLAMQEATETTVLGDFDDATFEHHGVTTTFSRRDGKYRVRTEGPDGALADYEVAYVFGVTPLQQYLIPFPRGRYQVLAQCWDTRSEEEGGQRWFHIYDQEVVRAGDVLHWTGPNQNWNYMCAECHSTNLRKNYDLEKDTFATTWSEIDVSCEACHGPASRHVAIAKATEDGRRPKDEAWQGLVVRLRDPDEATWKIDETTGNATRSHPLRSRAAIETCARCHSRREALNEDFVPGRPILDTHRVALLTEPLYQADGQILDEVYVYGSFVQSRMYREGVRCADCHDAHTARVHDDTDKLCRTCHLASKYESKEHHGHDPGTEGAACVDCHMPERPYMVVDPRRDHSMRVPRPDLTEELGSPDVCTRCHEDETPAWAAAEIDKWAGPDWRKPHFGQAIQAAREGRPGAERLLAKLAADTEQPGIARATALTMLRDRGAPLAVPAIRVSLRDADPLVRLGALTAARGLAPADRVPLAAPLLRDDVRLVRAEAARALAALPDDRIPAGDGPAFDAALAEYVAAQLVNAERPEAHLNLGVLWLERGDLARAERACRTALRVDPRSAAARVNLADLLRETGREDEGERVLREGLKVRPDEAALHHALGLKLVRSRELDEALRALARAAELEPANARYVYVYAVALESTGDRDGAIEVLEKALERHGRDRSILFALAGFHRDRGTLDDAVRVAKRLADLAPRDAQARAFLRQLETLRDR